MSGLVDLVEVSCFVGWDEGFSGAVDFFDVLSELVLEFTVLVSKFNASNHVVEVGFEVVKFVDVGRAFS